MTTPITTEEPAIRHWKRDLVQTLEQILYPERFEGDRVVGAGCGEYHITRPPERNGEWVEMTTATARLLLDRWRIEKRKP